VDDEGLALLLTREGWALLEALPPYDEEATLALSTALRAQGVDPRLAAAALTQSRLRARARAKFGEFAETMLFTQDGLEQATRLAVAARHARRYAAAGVTRVADLCCGVGGDAMALGGLGLEVLAVERDEATAACATVNLRHLPGVRVRHGDALAVDLVAEGVDAVYCDPSRRDAGGRRVFDPDACSPPLGAVLALQATLPELGVKVAPGIPHAALPADVHAQWVSIDGAVVEAGLWFGRLAPEGPGRSALLLGPAGATTLTYAGPPQAAVAPAPVGELEAYLYEPDGAVIRAGLLDRVCEAVGGHLVDPSIAYVTAAHLVPTPLAVGYRVLDRMPFSLKRLRAYLRSRSVGRVTIKKRGTAVDPAELRRRLDLRGPHDATLVLTRVAGAQAVLVVEPTA
jgi:protein-L-isoaspartate O-methyltransferase